VPLIIYWYLKRFSIKKERYAGKIFWWYAPTPVYQRLRWALWGVAILCIWYLLKKRINISLLNKERIDLGINPRLIRPCI
jgi:hypothetical protein